MERPERRESRWLRMAAASGIGAPRGMPTVPGCRRDHVGPGAASIVWLFFLALPLTPTFGDGSISSAHKAVVTVAVVAFAAAYMGCWVTRTDPSSIRRNLRLALLAMMVAIIVFLVLYDRPSWDYELIFCLFPAMRLGGYGPLPVVVLVATAVALGLCGGLDGGDLLVVVLILVGLGTSMFGVTRVFEANATLAAAEEDRAKVAVAEERIRFARDLHDLLGHSLSVVTLKSELAGRLLPTDPASAAVEVAEIERIARRALREVRDAVSGYRRPTLAVELAGARSALAAAGIAWSEDVADLDLHPDVEAALAWSLREGVTNVVRHSAASHCALVLRRSGSSAEVIVEDDGRAAAAGEEPPETGNGLCGLHERIALARGQLEAGPRAGGGWRLAACVPLAAGAAVDPDTHPAALGPTGPGADAEEPAAGPVQSRR